MHNFFIQNLLQLLTLANFACPRQIFHVVDSYLQSIRIEEMDEAV